jgi:hypothetical protein
MNWSGGFQWEFVRSWLAEFNYQGSSGVGLRGTVDANTLPQALYASRDTTLLDKVYQATQNYKPFPQFGTINYTTNLGHNTYHGVLGRVEKRYANGLTLQGSWSFSKNMSGAGGTGWSYYNWTLTKARAASDLNQRALVAMTYELPFGKGRKWMNGGGKKNWLLGNWDFMATQMGQTGHPMSVSYGGSPSRYLPGASRPNQILPNDQAQIQGWTIGPNRFPATAQNPYLNISAFQYPAAYTPGTLGANTFTGPRMIWAQLQLTKRFQIKEKYTILVRWDMNNPYKYNSFTLGNPTYNLQSAPSFARNFGTFDNWGSVGGRLNSWVTVRMEF